MSNTSLPRNTTLSPCDGGEPLSPFNVKVRNFIEKTSEKLHSEKILYLCTVFKISELNALKKSLGSNVLAMHSRQSKSEQKTILNSWVHGAVPVLITIREITPIAEFIHPLVDIDPAIVIASNDVSQDFLERVDLEFPKQKFFTVNFFSENLLTEGIRYQKLNSAEGVERNGISTIDTTVSKFYIGNIKGGASLPHNVFVIRIALMQVYTEMILKKSVYRIDVFNKISSNSRISCNDRYTLNLDSEQFDYLKLHRPGDCFIATIADRFYIFHPNKKISNYVNFLLLRYHNANTELSENEALFKKLLIRINRMRVVSEAEVYLNLDIPDKYVLTEHSKFFINVMEELDKINCLLEFEIKLK